VLGLAPGAEWTAVERAYKTLIKTHHPDRAGGNAVRAAEINRAYRELRQERGARIEDHSWLEPEISSGQRSGAGRWAGAAVAIAAGAALLVLLTMPVSGLIDDFRMRAGQLDALGHRRAISDAEVADPMTQPLVDAAIRDGIAKAAKLAKSKDEAAMAQASRDCHAQLRAKPSLAQLDRCAAFDDAIIQLQDRDPLRDDGPFGQVSVTARQMSSGGLLSDDYLAVDSRLARVRLQVELALAAKRPLPSLDTESNSGA
jgi:hypothetical protein